MCFESKKDFIMGFLIWMPLYFITIVTISAQGYFIDFMLFCMLILVGWVWLGTRYCINNGVLYVTCGPFKEKISIGNIRSIKSNRSFKWGAALSIDRLEINYGKDGKIFISPKDKDQFISEIKRENRTVHVMIK